MNYKEAKAHFGHAGIAKAISQHDGAQEKIHIKPSHRGLLHKELGVPLGKPIPKAKIEKAAHSKNPAERKRAVFAENFGHKK